MLFTKKYGVPLSDVKLDKDIAQQRLTLGFVTETASSNTSMTFSKILPVGWSFYPSPKAKEFFEITDLSGPTISKSDNVEMYCCTEKIFTKLCSMTFEFV